MPSTSAQNDQHLATARIDESFQALLLSMAAMAAEGSDLATLIRRFCASTREFFGVSGTYYWRLAEGTLIGLHAEGHMAERFVGARLSMDASAVAVQAVRDRKAVYVNGLDGEVYPMAGSFGARSLMAAPLIVAGEAIGACVFLHAQDENYFNNDLADKATILVAALGSLAEGARLAEELRAEHRRADIQSKELQQLLAITSELGSTGKLDKFLQQFAVRAAEFLGFGRSFIALTEADGCYVRWAAVNGAAQPMDVKLVAPATEKVLRTGQPYWTDDPASDPDLDSKAVAQHGVKQYLAVPLLGSQGEPLGLFGVLDRVDGQRISPEDVRRAQTLAAAAAVALEATRNLHLSEEHRRRFESLMSLALELNSSLRMPDFVRGFTTRAADMLGAKAAALALAQRATLEVVILHDPGRRGEKPLMRRLNLALSDLAQARPEAVICGEAAELIGAPLAEALGWRDLVLARLRGGDDELLGLLCLAGRGRPLDSADRNLLQALCGHASVALENARLFSRIAQSNRQWAEIFDAITDFIVVHDDAHKVLRVNRSLADFIGVRPAELIGIGMRALTVMANPAGAEPCPLCRPGQHAEDEYIHHVLDRTYLVSNSRIHGALNEGMQTIHVLRDITDRREAERRYRELFDNIQEGLYFSAPEGRFIEVNDALVRMLGYSSREELLQIDLPRQLYANPQEREPFRAALEEKGTLQGFEEPLRRKDGSLIHTLQNAYAVRDAQGKVVQYRGLMLDVTAVKNFQAQLQQQRDFNDKILNNTQSLILVADVNGLVSYANRRSFQAGAYSEAQLVGQRLADFVPPARRQHFQEAFAATLAGQQVDNLELQLVRGNATTGQFSVNLSPMRDEQGNVNNIVIVMTDVSDAAVLQAKLMHTEKMAAVGQLVSGVAHEVNNPLTAILGFADLLLSADLPHDAKKDLAVIVQEAQRTKTIVQNLLSFARQVPPQREPVQVNDLLRRTLQLRSYDLSNRGVDVREQFTEPLPAIVGDSHQLQQVFLNILNNAYDAVCEAGRRGLIEVSTGARGNQVEISFRDNGNGIPCADRIFDPFFTTKEVGKGTGLGLSICYGIVREHGGEISVSNNSEQPGATFVVRLPLAHQTASPGGKP